MKKNILLVLLAMISFLYSAGITIGPNARVSFGNVNVNVYGNLKNTLVKDGVDEKLGQITVLPTSKVSFVGSSQDTVTNIYTFPNVVINKPSGNVLIANNTNSFVLTNNITFTKGSVLTGTSTFELGTTATVSGESTNGYIVGTAKAARTVGTGTNSFGGIGYSINNTGSDLGTVTVYRYTGDGNEVVLYGSEGIWRKWDVQTSNAFSGTRQVTTSWLSNEDNGNVLANLKVWKYETAKSSGSEDVIPGVRNVKLADKQSAKSFEREIVSEDDEEIVVEEEPKTLGWVEVDGAVFNTASSPRTATYTINAATQYTINDVANAFADGSGTESNPYQIATLDQLNAVRYYLTAHFIQVADIDASATSTWNSGAGWAPITSFAGKYNGDGHTVSNLYVYRPGTTYVGLFGSTLSGSEIKDLGLENADVTGGNETGAFVGTSRGTIRASYANGSVNSTGYRVGGFMGYSQDVGSSVSNCYSDVTVTRLDGNSETINFGGFCGRLYRGDINSCYSLGQIVYETGTDPTDKGFLGAQSGGTMSNSFWNTVTSLQSTSAGNATGLTKDQMRTLSIFTDATWDFQDESANGVEDIWGINAVENNGYPFLSWEGITHNPSPFAGGIGTSDEPFLVSNLTQLDAVRNFLSYNFLQTADIDASATSTWDSGAGWTPIGNSTTKFTGNYDGQDYFIDSIFINRTTTYNGLFGYTQGSTVSNIVLSNASITSNQNYTGVLSGYINVSEIYDCKSNGQVTGASFTGGLTGYNNGSLVSDCTSNVAVTAGSTYSGGIVGYNYNSSTVIRCSAIGNVTGTTYVGGIAGRSIVSSAIYNSFSKGIVSGSNYIGGLIGQNYTACEIDNCYSLSDVKRLSGTLTVLAGFVGQNYSGIINNCYSTGSVKHVDGTDLTDRGFVASIGTGYVMNGNFWNTETSEQSGNGVASTATGLSNAEMCTMSIFTSAGWDFYGESVNGTDDYWNMHTSLNSGYPYLNWEYRIPVEAPANLALAVGASDVTITWDAVTGATGYLVYSSADPYGTFILDETGVFNGTEWTGPLTGTKMFYYVAAVNDTKVITAKTINIGGNAGR
ncbi:MAG TPA: GLUG motif-containing protein [Clostridiales bacterium]|nr:GLUG motif-containing protein [Clostridiales bacterium]